MTPSLGEKIRRLRAEAGLTQPELANRAEINQSYLSKIENDNVVPSEEILLRICDVFKLSIEQILIDIDPQIIKRHFQHIPSLFEKIDEHKNYLAQLHRWWAGVAISLIVFGLFVFVVGQFKIFFSENHYTYRAFLPEDYLTKKYESAPNANYWGVFDYFVSHNDLGQTTLQERISDLPLIYEFAGVAKESRRINHFLSALGMFLAAVGLFCLVGEKQLKPADKVNATNLKGFPLSKIIDRRVAFIFTQFLFSIIILLIASYSLLFFNKQYTYENTAIINLSNGTKNRDINLPNLTTSSYRGVFFSEFLTVDGQPFYREYEILKISNNLHVGNKILITLFPILFAIAAIQAFLLYRDRRKLKTAVI